MAERGLAVDHATLNRWIGKYAVAIADEAHRRKAHICRSWRMDETYIKVAHMVHKGQFDQTGLSDFKPFAALAA